jgi:TRIAP1/MDM35 family protein
MDMISQRALKDRGIDKMLDEARADNRENDLENMKPGSD